MSADWSISRLQSWTCSSLPAVAEFVKLTQSIVIEIQRQSADLYKVQLCNRQFSVVSTAIYVVKVYTADFGHSGPRLAIASCGHSGNCTLRHWIRSHDRAQYGSCTLGPVWQLPVWIRMAPHIGACHSGHSWQLSLGPRVAATWLFMVIYYFLLFYTKMR